MIPVSEFLLDLPAHALFGSDANMIVNLPAYKNKITITFFRNSTSHHKKKVFTLTIDTDKSFKEEALTSSVWRLDPFYTAQSNYTAVRFVFLNLEYVDSGTYYASAQADDDDSTTFSSNAEEFLVKSKDD